MTDGAAFMYWFLLVASSMGDEKKPRVLSQPPPLTGLSNCDVFLAPSTIPGSACMDIKKQTQHHFTRCVSCYCTVQILYLEFLGRIGDGD